MKRKYFRWVLAIAWMTVIFIFSSQSGENSNENNRMIVYIFNLLGLDLDKALGGFTNFIIRKAAHVTEYLILYLLLYRALIEDFNIGKSLFTALVCTFLYACTDELHQAFVPDRGPSFKDVLIDTGGGTIGMIFSFLFHKRKRG